MCWYAPNTKAMFLRILSQKRAESRRIDSEQRISAEISATPNGFDKIKVYLWKDMTRLVPFTDTIEWN